MIDGARWATHRLALVAAGLLVVAAPGVGDSAPRAGTHNRAERARAAERVHVVKAGETLAAIAERYGVSVTALVASNKLRGARARLRVGQRLVIPKAHPPRAARARVEPAPLVPFNMVLSIPDLDGRLVPFEWPIEGTVISQFGRRRAGWHRGLDIKADMGIPVLAAGPGVVITSSVEYRYGNVVKIEHENSFVTVYAHLLQNFVTVGDAVYRGQVIGQVGRTGRATGYHLHFEIRYAGSVYNPLYLLPSPPRMTEVWDTEEEANDDE